MQTSTDLRALTTEARRLFSEFKEGENAIESGFDLTLDRAWKFGTKLNQLKQMVGHGSWEKWRADSFPGLSKRGACNCMALDRNNPNVQNSAHLSAESVRKFRFGYVPVKDRKKLKGDKKFARPAHHHSGVVNECNKLARRIDAGHYKPNRKELQRDFKPFYQWLTILYEA